MAIPKFRQFRYFGDNSNRNNIDILGLTTGTPFTEDIKIITQLGVRALPGTKFYINYNSEPVIVGFLGIFELDFTGKGAITHLSFDSDSVSAINENLHGGYIIVDIFGDGGE